MDPDEDDEENLGTIIVGLMQIGRRKLRKEGKDLLTIGYVIYEVCKLIIKFICTYIYYLRS